MEIRRFSRPNFSQGSNVGRLFNSGILQLKWLCGFFRRRREFDAVLVGTDPQFAYLMFPFLRLMNRRIRLIHWAFDPVSGGDSGELPGMDETAGRPDETVRAVGLPPGRRDG